MENRNLCVVMRKAFFIFACFAATALIFLNCGHNEDMKKAHGIVLFTDFGDKDAYVPQVKGAIKSINPKIEILDLAHNNNAYDIETASYLLDKSARFFPAGTIFVAVVDPGVGSGRKSVLVVTKADKIYVGPDNGLFTRIVQREGIKEAREITESKFFLNTSPSSTFHGRDIFAPIAAHLSLDVKPEDVGHILPKLQVFPIDTPTVMGSHITGKIVYIDRFGNVITNINSQHISELKPGQLIRVTHKGETHSMPFLKTYADAPDGRLMALLNSDDELEFAIQQKNASNSMNAKIGETIVIKF